MQWTPGRPTPPNLDAGFRSSLARHEVSRLRLGAWSVINQHLILRIRPAGRSDELALPLGADLTATAAIELANGTVRIESSQLATWDRSAAQVVAVARASGVTQRLNRLTTTVESGADQGARLTVLIGGPGVGGLVVDLNRVIDGDPVRALIVVASDHVLLVGQTIGGAEAESRRALAARLVTLSQTGAGHSPGGVLAQSVFQFLEPGRLAMFEAEDT